MGKGSGYGKRLMASSTRNQIVAGSRPSAFSHQRVLRRRPTLPHPSECSTIGAVSLSFRVRDGTGRFPHAITTANLPPPHTAVRVETCSRTYHPPPPTPRTGTRWLWDGVVPKPYSGRETRCYSHPKRGCKTCCVCEDHRLISTGQLHESSVLATTSSLSTQ